MIKSLFNDNEVYGTADINNVFTHLTSGGVISVSDSVVTAALESGVAQIATDGVEFHNPEACRVIKDSRGYIVSNGSAFMPDGSIVTVNGDGEKVSGVVSGSVNYVFFQRSSERNGTYAVAATALPSDTSNILLLAEIDASGNITDKREYSTTKLVPSSGNIYITKEASFHYWGANKLDDENSLIAEIDIGWNAYKYMRVIFKYYNLATGVTESDNPKWTDISSGSAELSTTIYNNGCAFSFVKNGGKLEIYQIYASSNSAYGQDGIAEIELF